MVKFPIFVCSACCFVVGCSNSSDSEDAQPTRVAEVRPSKVTRKRIQDVGFRPGPRAEYYHIDKISLGDLCALLDCKLDDFGYIPGAGPGPENCPREFDGGDVRSLYWYLSDETYYSEPARSDPKILVKASIVIYDKDNPRPVIKRQINKPGEKPSFEYEPRPKLKSDKP